MIEATASFAPRPSSLTAAVASAAALAKLASAEPTARWSPRPSPGAAPATSGSWMPAAVSRETSSCSSTLGRAAAFVLLRRRGANGESRMSRSPPARPEAGRRAAPPGASGAGAAACRAAAAAPCFLSVREYDSKLRPLLPAVDGLQTCRSPPVPADRGPRASGFGTAGASLRAGAGAASPGAGVSASSSAARPAGSAVLLCAYR